MSLQDELAQAISDSYSRMMGATSDMDLPKFNAGDAQLASDVLASEPMQRIRSFIEWFARRHGTEDDMRAVMRDEASLPESVIEWVLGGEA